jgi:hypothetical protein
MKTNLSSLHSLVDTNGLRDIRPPVDIPSGWAWLWWSLAFLVLAVLAWLAWRAWQKRRTQVPVIPAVPPHIRARQKLQQALALITDPEPFVVAVSGALRVYLEERFTYRAPERTTEEFLHELRESRHMSVSQKDVLGDFLTRCDLVKFAKYQPTETELRDLHDSAVRLVDETEPKPEPVTPGQSANHNSQSTIQ